MSNNCMVSDYGVVLDYGIASDNVTVSRNDIYLPGKRGYVFVLVALVSLSVCLSVGNITQKVMNRLG